ncbi:MAG: histidine phosphatase family protein [Pseudomonadota bacterium]
MTTTRLIIARHGNTFNEGEEARRVGKTDLSLVDSGLIQGTKLGEYFLKSNLLPDIIFTSELKRTIETARQIENALGIIIKFSNLSIFNEIDYGIDENQPESEVIKRIGIEAIKDWDENAIVPQGWIVNPEEIIENWLSFSRDIVEKYFGKNILVVTSNGIARFSPYITGDFKVFAENNKLKISTGAFAIFENYGDNTNWHCKGWNVKP